MAVYIELHSPPAPNTAPLSTVSPYTAAYLQVPRRFLIGNMCLPLPTFFASLMSGGIRGSTVSVSPQFYWQEVGEKNTHFRKI